MQIRDTRPEVKGGTALSCVGYGDPFLFRDEIYIKTNTKGGCVHVSTGAVCAFDSGVEVTPLPHGAFVTDAREVILG